MVSCFHGFVRLFSPQNEHAPTLRGGASALLFTRPNDVSHFILSYLPGAEFGVRNAGHYAINSLRIEKFYRAWGSDVCGIFFCVCQADNCVLVLVPLSGM